MDVLHAVLDGDVLEWRRRGRPDLPAAVATPPAAGDGGFGAQPFGTSAFGGTA